MSTVMIRAHAIARGFGDEQAVAGCRVVDAGRAVEPGGSLEIPRASAIM